MLCYFLVTVIFVLIVWLVGKPRNYSEVYNRNEVEILESYTVSSNLYRFDITYNGVVYEFGNIHKYNRKHRLIDEVKFYSEDGVSCVYPRSHVVELYPLCFDGEKFIDYDLLENQSEDFYSRNKEKDSSVKFKNVDIYNKSNVNYLVWANKGYYFINEKEDKELFFLDKESYYNNLAYQTREYVFTPNYDEEYNFKKVFIVNLRTGKVSEWELPFEIGYNSYFLGDHDGWAYLVDRKEKREYRLNFKKKKIERIDKNGEGVVWNEGFEEMSITKLVNEDFKFVHRNAINYSSKDQLSFRFDNSKNEVKVLDKSVNILFQKGLDVYYLEGEEFFRYSPLRGEERLLKYSEWNFNNMNSIYVFQKS